MTVAEAPHPVVPKVLSFDLSGREWFYELDVVEVASCYTDRFQRELNERWLCAREADFRPWLLGSIVVSERPKRQKRFSVVDGQHRVELLTRKGVPVVAACILSGLSIEEEAGIFSDLQQERRGINAYERFQANLVAKRPMARAIDAMLADPAIRLELTSRMDGPGKIKCVRQLERVYEDDPARLRLILTLVQRTWPGMPGARAERFIGGLWRFIRDEDKRASQGVDTKITGGQSIDMDRFVEKLGGRTPSALVLKAQQLKAGSEHETTSLPAFIAEAVSNAYRSRRR